MLPRSSAAPRPPRSTRFVVGLAMLAGLAGCPSPGSYGTPRTVPRGRVAHTLAVEVVHAEDVTTKNVPFARTFPSTPTYVLRAGLWDRGELGLRLAHLSSLGADLKWNFLRTYRFDMAIDPGAQIFVTPTSGNAAVTGYVHVPLLFGINVSRRVSFVPTFGVTVSASSLKAGGESTFAAATDTGALGRAGLGVNLRVRPTFALHPEVTVLRSFDATGRTFVLAGLGVSFGHLPDYDSDDPEIAAERAAAGWTEPRE
ncbi:MAG: hypothetical protein U0169_25345 [Polyangiaceae bacterium]